jgi:hypothetical protein
MIAQMNAQTQLTVGMVKQLSEGNGTRGPSMLEILSSPAVIALATLLLQNRKDPTDLALKIAEVMKPAAAPPAAASGTDVLSALEKGIALATRLGNRGGGGDGAGESIMPVVAEGIKGIAAVVGAIAQERANASGTGAAPIPQRIAAPAPPPAVLEHEGSHVAPPNDRPWLAVVRPSLGFLLDAARFMSPSSAADTIGRNLTDEQFTDLRDDIADVTPPGFLGRLAQEFPPIANVPAPWLAELVAELEAVELTDEPEPDAATPPAA